jgi:hypothetical protein
VGLWELSGVTISSCQLGQRYGVEHHDHADQHGFLDVSDDDCGQPARESTRIIVFANWRARI